MSLNKEIRYNTPLHSTIREAILARKRLSETKLQDRRAAWAKAEETALAYVATTDTDAKRKKERLAGHPQYTTIEIPYSYAMLLSAHTYWSSVFLGRTPVLQYATRFGKNEQQQLAVEALMDYQTGVGEHTLPLYVWLYDAGKYGLGIIGHYWAEETSTVSSIEEQPVTFMGIEIPGKTKRVRKIEKVKGYSGNRLYNVRPQDWFPDPRVTVANFQRGEFCGRYTEVGWNTILRGQESGRYFNIAALQAAAKAGGSDMRDTGSAQLDIPDASNDQLITVVPKDVGFVKIIEMVIELVPRDWGLGESTSPEKWLFELGNEQVVIAARPYGYYHDKFNYDVIEYEIEGYALTKRSMLDIVQPLNDTMNWLVNAHFYNVRKALNDQVVVDPSRVVMKDLTDPNAGRIVRLKDTAYGTDPRLAVHQLQITDVTRTHMNDTQIVAELMQRATGVVDNIMGMVNSGGRKTATEVRSSSTFGINRLKTVTEYMSAMGFTPFAAKLLQNTQQFYNEDWMLKVAGDTLSGGSPFVNVTPDTIQGQYDFVPVDGNMPIDRFAQANLWKELMAGMQASPALSTQYDMVRMFSWVAKLAGMRSIDSFRVKVTPDAVLASQTQAGNVIPMRGGGDGQGNVGGGAETGVEGAPRLAGLGPVA